jgi:putative oxidoreductase
MTWGIPIGACHPSLVHHVDLGLLVLRLTVGLTLVAHGTNKFFGGGRLPGTARWFESMGVRPGRANAVLAATTEVVAGLGVAAGLFTPLSAAGIIALMLVAIVVSHRKNGFFIFRPGQGWEYCAVLALAAFSIATIGAGQWSIDHALDLDVEGWTGAVVAAVVGLLGAALQLAVCYRPTRPAPAEVASSS